MNSSDWLFSSSSTSKICKCEYDSAKQDETYARAQLVHTNLICHWWALLLNGFVQLLFSKTCMLRWVMTKPIKNAIIHKAEVQGFFVIVEYFQNRHNELMLLAYSSHLLNTKSDRNLVSSWAHNIDNFQIQSGHVISLIAVCLYIDSTKQDIRLQLHQIQIAKLNLKK